MKKIIITQVKSSIDRPERQKLTLKALGLNKLNASRSIEATPQALGMVRAVEHLLKVEEVAQDEQSQPTESSAASKAPEHLPLHEANESDTIV